MLTVWRLDGLQSHCLGKRSWTVKVAGQSSAGRSRQWSCVPASFRNRDRQQGMSWCAVTWCYLKKQLRAVCRDNAGEYFIACCFGRWHVSPDVQGGTLHLCGRGSSLGDESTGCIWSCRAFTPVFDPAAACSQVQLPPLCSIVPSPGETHLVCRHPFPKSAGNVQLRPPSQVCLAPPLCPPHLLFLGQLAQLCVPGREL